MIPTTQSGTHPEAESLTAFAEQLLPATEREQVLAHMATCSRCREVVFLAQRAAAEDATAPSIPASRQVPGKPGRSWFAGWRFAWIPAAALAGFVGLAVVQHFRQASSEKQIAGNFQQLDARRNAEVAQTTAKSPAAQPFERQAKPAMRASSSLGSSVRADKFDMVERDEKKVIKQKEETTKIASSAGQLQGIGVGGIGRGLSAPARSPSGGGPLAANQFQQQNMNVDQNAAQELKDAETLGANKPAPTAPASTSETVTVQAESRVAPSTPSYVNNSSIGTLSGKSFDQSLVTSERLRKTAKASLPSGLTALSTASSAERTIAIDMSGAMFLSEDKGKHWTPVKAQWTGRATLVRVRQAAGLSGGVLTNAVPQFELMNDQARTWVSSDGKTWTPETPAPK